MQPRRPMSPGGPKSDLHQPKAKNQPQGQLAALLHGKLEYEDLIAGNSSSLFPDDHRSNSAPPTQQLLNSNRAAREGLTEGRQRQLWQEEEPNVQDPRRFNMIKSNDANPRQRNLVDLIQQVNQYLNKTHKHF
ncbi:hypothetical protein G6F56_010283 [Rhizopus delemar]|nr:hypothetical protein G6F56_010283 [Rhizopus delemar]